MGDGDPAPALGRGLHVLRLLGRTPGSTLEDLVRATSWPRSSLARLLTSLERNGAVARADGRGWQATALLAPTVEAGALDAWRKAPAALARHGVRGELYAFTGDGPVLMAAVEPDDWMVRSVVQVGWHADPTELLALVQLWWAHAVDRPARRGWYWQERERRWLERAALGRLIDRVRLAPYAECLARNHNALRRCAVPLRRGGQVVGALVAVRFCLSAKERVPAVVRTALSRLAG